MKPVAFTLWNQSVILVYSYMFHGIGRTFKFIIFRNGLVVRSDPLPIVSMVTPHCVFDYGLRIYIGSTVFSYTYY